jgi:uncharacterized membrane protein YgcG
MAGSLSKFATTIRTRGVAKASKYKIKFSLPPMMQQFANRAETIELMAEATQFPEFSLLTQRIVDDGIGREVAYDKTFPPIMMAFICTGGMDAKFFFDFWVTQIAGSMSGKFNYPSNYIADSIQIFQCDEAENERYCVTLIDAYPKLVSDVPLNANSRDYNRVQVQFVYRLWYSETAGEVDQIEISPSAGNANSQKLVFPEIGKRNSLGDTGMVASDVPIEERIANTESRISNIEERMSSVPFESGGGSFAGGGASGSW